MFAKFASGKLFGKFQKTLMVALVLVMLFSSLPLGKAQAANAVFNPSTVKCYQGQFTVSDQIYGAYAGQWVAVRYSFYFQSPGSTQLIYAGSTKWVTEQLPGPNVYTYGGNKTFFWGKGAVQVITHVLFWNGAQWGPEIKKIANHIIDTGYAWSSNNPYCFVN